ncbi:amidohydrolase [Rhodococcus sp. NCIMB 12038]|uniref:amidohydrolase n=1 Tax=Rhodococcus sp. NCIMB 12038 TaxID=933800 RepID=UPI000B3D0056|nr:amidohydrolase [Rhodococcus sp. NCIMB 12038]OUS83464.1 amidohydrolase [Rhodococcus sp. NCIMB 12038]
MSVDPQLLGTIDELGPQYAALSDAIWDNPELRWEEHASVDAQIAAAEAEGFTVTRSVAGIPTAFSAEAGDGQPVIAIVGEYDALAGLSQKAGSAVPEPEPGNESGNGQGCGHHLLGGGSLLAATAVKRYLDANGLPGTVRYYGCPAEEAAAGKTFMVKEGAFDDVDAAVSWHPGDTTTVQRIRTLAYVQAYVRFTGIAAHAGVSPERGRSALDALELMNVGTNFLREHMPSDCRIHYAILDAGGRSPNVVQASAEAYYLVRSPDVAGMRELFARVTKIAEGAALMTETTVEIEIDGGCSDILPNVVLEDSMQERLRELGPVPFDDTDLASAEAFTTRTASGRTASTLGGEFDSDGRALHTGIVTFDARSLRPTMTGSSDLGDVSWVTPLVQCATACVGVGTAAHSWQMVAQGKLPAAHKGMIHAAKIMASTAVDLLTDAELLASARKEFSTRTKQTPYDSPLPDGIVAPPLREIVAVAQ